MSRKIKLGDFIYNKHADWQVLKVHREDKDRGVYWSSYGTSINIKDAKKLPASPVEMAKMWRAAVAFGKTKGAWLTKGCFVGPKEVRSRTREAYRKAALRLECLTEKHSA